MGSVPLHLDNDDSIVVDNVLYLPDAVLGNTADEPTVLISTRKLAKQGIGTHFLEGGDKVDFTQNGRVIGSFISTSKDDLYVQNINIETNNRFILLAECEEALKRLGGKTEAQKQNNFNKSIFVSLEETFFRTESSDSSEKDAVPKDSAMNAGVAAENAASVADHR